MTADSYYISQAGAVTGPFTTDQIRGMWTGGKITADAFCLKEGASDWRELRHAPELTEPIPTTITVKGLDPFAHLHTPIKGRAEGNLTWLGWAGIIIGVLSLILLPFRLGILGALMGVAAYLWCRKPVAAK